MCRTLPSHGGAMEERCSDRPFQCTVLFQSDLYPSIALGPLERLNGRHSGDASCAAKSVTKNRLPLGKFNRFKSISPDFHNPKGDY